MAGRDKRRRAAPLEGDEQQLRRRQEEAALLLRRIKEVAVVDRAINDICILFKCSRHNLNVVGSCSERV
ncbi:unnamed protein product [Miscanthus lutarioriparius]|uniref:Uncharacterized protein n=1 Tax=Miscanthus lutarioriparius TaxID=422564 RepID=A0A811MLW3_9POAL|nr:unnamed protein product [Miscanthus lutarioriparius]